MAMRHRNRVHFAFSLLRDCRKCTICYPTHLVNLSAEKAIRSCMIPPFLEHVLRALPLLHGMLLHRGRRRDRLLQEQTWRSRPRVRAGSGRRHRKVWVDAGEAGPPRRRRAVGLYRRAFDMNGLMFSWVGHLGWRVTTTATILLLDEGPA